MIGDLQAMPRKFRLSVHRKNEYRKACAGTVSVQHIPMDPAAVTVTNEPSPPEELKVSVPLDLVNDFELSTVAELRDRIMTLSLLPQGMVHLCVVLFDTLISFLRMGSRH